MRKRLVLVIAGLVVMSSLATALLIAEEKPPTGACTITAYNVPPSCTSPMTEKSCYAVAKKVGAVANWEKGKSCPRK